MNELDAIEKEIKILTKKFKELKEKYGIKENVDSKEGVEKSILSFLQMPKSDRELVHACRAYRNLDKKEREKVINKLANDDLLEFIPKSSLVDKYGFRDGKGKPSRADRYMAKLFPKKAVF